jgi:hypothetical protein
MPRPTNNGGRYEVHSSGAIARRLKQIQKQAKKQGRGEQVLSAIRQIWHRLSYDPLEFGEPLYHLPALRLQVRHGIVSPLRIYFGVHEDKPLVFIKVVTLLPQPEA